MAQIPTFIDQAANWVVTDVSYRASRQDVVDYMESIYPTKLDAYRQRWVQRYKIEVRLSPPPKCPALLTILDLYGRQQGTATIVSGLQQL